MGPATHGEDRSTMRKHTTARHSASATMPIAGAILAATATVLLGGCTTSSTPPAAKSTTTSGPTASATTAAGGSPTGASLTSGAPSIGSSSLAGAAGSAPACGGDQLSLSIPLESAGGLFNYMVLEFVNHGAAACTVEGYPGAAVYNATGSAPALNSSRQLTGHVDDQYTSPAPITLAPGATASTILEWVDKPTDGHPYANCVSFRTGTLGITAPNTTQTTHIPLHADVCSDVLIHPLIPGGTGRQTG